MSSTTTAITSVMSSTTTATTYVIA
jgi:hypothetical protein